MTTHRPGGPAAAQGNHRHVLVTGNGDCVILAKQRTSRFVTLPEASFNNTTEPTTTANPHPLHVHVHRGQPGEVQAIAVYGSEMDPCRETGNYVNGP
ncbi:MAG: hypothetical protein ACRDPC_12175 [Solirubrobacteraceae bacterium]